MKSNQRRTGAVSGMNRTYRGARIGAMYGTAGKKKPARRGLSARLIMILGGVALAALLAVALSYAMAGVGRSDVGRVTRLGATLNQNVVPFGDSVVFYDGMTLHCVSSSGGNEWSYQIGTKAYYDATDEHIVAWSGNDVYMLNRHGRLVFNDNLSDSIQFASAGEDYVAVFIGEQDNGVINVMNAEGQIVDNITIENQTVLDMGFFKSPTTTSTQETELLWVLGLNTTGTVISTELQTFQPGKLVTGKSSLGEHIAYSVYFAGDRLHVVDTRQIGHYNYRVLEQETPTLIYGYTLKDVLHQKKTTYQLLIPSQEEDKGVSFTNVRLMYDDVDRMLHLPGPCSYALLGSRSVYAFSGNAVYVCRYGDTAFTAYAMPVHVTTVLGMLDGDRVVVGSGSEIYVVELPG